MQVYKANEANIAKYKESIFPQNSEQELTLEQRKLQEEFFSGRTKGENRFFESFAIEIVSIRTWDLLVRSFFL